MIQPNLVQNFLKYQLTSKSRHAIHSPFVYDLIENVISDNKKFYAFQDVEKVRTELLSNNNKIFVEDFGTKGREGNYQNERKISSIANAYAIKPKYGRLLFRLVNYFKPACMIELGTSLGISTMYQSYGALNSRFYTLEGCNNSQNIAKNNFHKAGLKNISAVCGEFDKTLPQVLSTITQLNYAFIDGNHAKDPTLKYFHLLMEKSNDNTILVFDDIHWSQGMDEAWKTIKNHPKINVTIDLFALGIAFLRPEQSKEHFVIKY